MRTGWIKLHRSIMDNPLWESEPFSKGQAWIDLLLLVNIKKTMITVKNGLVLELERGEIGVSVLGFSERWSWSCSKVKRFFELLIKQNMIQLKIVGNRNIINILNYDEYQERTVNEHLTKTKRTVNEDLTNSKRTLNEHSIRSKEDKKDKNKENTYGDSPPEGGGECVENSSSQKAQKTKEQGEAFKLFYAAYPRKKKPKDAEKAFRKAWKELPPIQELLEIIRRKQWPDDPQFIPYPASWLNAGGWLEVDGAAETETYSTIAELAQPSIPEHSPEERAKVLALSKEWREKRKTYGTNFAEVAT